MGVEHSWHSRFFVQRIQTFFLFLSSFTFITFFTFFGAFFYIYDWSSVNTLRSIQMRLFHCDTDTFVCTSMCCIHKHCRRAFQGYQHRWPWRTLNAQNRGFSAILGYGVHWASEFSLKLLEIDKTTCVRNYTNAVARLMSISSDFLSR